MFIPERREDPVSTIPPPGVGYHTFLGLVSAGAGLSLLSVILRLYSRFRGPRRLYWDDGFVIFAEALVLATFGLWMWAAKFMFYVLDLRSGMGVPGPQLPEYLRHWLNVQLTVELFFYTTLVLVKLSFLFFFRRLGKNVQRQEYIWWPVLVFSLIVYVISLADVQYKCLNGSFEFESTWCTSAEANNFTMDTLRANMALDVFSDFLIMLIPITMLWNVRLQWRRKLAFMGLFSLSIITIVVAIVRAVNVNSSRQGSGQDDSTFLWLWSAIQAPLAVIIACLSAFPQLFTTSGAKKKPVWTPTDTYYQRLKARMKARDRSKDTSYFLSAISLSDQPDATPTANNASGNSPGANRENDTASYDSERPWLVPNGASPKPVVVSYGESTVHNDDVAQSNHIHQHLEYQVTWQQTPQKQSV